jgi:GntR family transcriptional regulator / MocR family aminotransferase
VADPERIVVCSGYSQAVASLARALVTVGQPRIAMEDPSLPAHRRLVEDAGAQVIPVPVDAQGIDVNRIRLAAPGAVITTPAHQYPLGVTLAPARRADLARWARHEGGVVIEDDYDGEFRFDRQPAGAMQALEPDHIVYAGTASKSLSPALRMGWLVLPAWLVEPFVAARGYGDTVSSIDQLTMADFIEGHGMDRHLRRMRSVYRRRRDALLATLARGPRPLALLGVAAGLHAVVDLRGTGHNEQGLLQQAGEAGIALGGLDDCWIADEGWDGLIVGYSRPAPHQFPATLAALTALLHGPGQPPR